MKRFILMIVIFVTTVVLCVLSFEIDLKINYYRVKLDGDMAEIQSLLFGNDIKYSENFTHEKFSKIKLNMTEKEVITILGEPISKFEPQGHANDSSLINNLGYRYSYSSSWTNYRVRNIIFEKGRVIKIIHYYVSD